MNRWIWIAAILLAGCSGAPETAPNQVVENEAAGVAMEVPANDTTARDMPGPKARAAGYTQGVMGAVDGPCGSTRVADYAGKRYAPSLEPELLRKSKARKIWVYHWNGKTKADEPSDTRTLDLILDPDERIVLIQCG